MKQAKIFCLICLLPLFSIISFKGIAQTRIPCIVPQIDLVERDQNSQHASATQNHLWEVGQTITVRLLEGGSTRLRNKVINAAREWEKYANIKFQFVSSGPADIRISFENGAGSYSFIGTDTPSVEDSDETMNIDPLNSNDEEYIDGVVLHEFGHALGLWHEHQNPINNIQWNKEFLYNQNSHLTRAEVDNLYFNKLSSQEVYFCEYDPASVMHYPLTSDYTLNGFTVPYASTLSQEDKRFIAALYPFNNSRNELACGFCNSSNCGTDTYNLTIRTTEGSGTINVGTTNESLFSCSSDCSKSYRAGQNLGLTAVPNAGYQFVRWQNGPCNNSTATTCNLPLNNSLSIEAVFEPTPTTDLSGKYRIRNVWRNKYLSQVHDYESSPLYTSPLNEDWQSQLWEVEKGPDGIYRLQCKWKDWYLNVEGDYNGAPTNAYPLEENWGSQMWYIEPVGDGTYRLKNRWSNRYLHVGSNERAIVQDLQVDWKSQMWVLEPVNAGNDVDPHQLKQVAAEVGVKYGTPLEPFIIGYPPLYRKHISAGTVPVYWKYTTHAEEGPPTWEAADAIVDFGQELGLDLRGHPLAWGADFHIPEWVLAKPNSAGESILLEHIGAVVGRYAGRIKSWDVVNEAINDDGTFRNCYWNRAMTAEYIIKAFRKAHQTDPSADLVYNDYGMETNRQKFEGIKNLLGWLQSENVGLTGLGWQLHVDVEDVLDDNFALAAYMAEISCMGLENIVTELDIRIPDNSPYQLARQKQAYKKITNIFLNNTTRGDYFMTWGLSDRYTWWNDFDPSRIHYPLPFDTNLDKKPAFWGMYEAFQEYQENSLPLTGAYRLKNVWRNNYLSQGHEYEGSALYTHSLNEDWGSQIWEVKKGADGTYRLQCKWKDWYLSVGDTIHGTPAIAYPLNENWWSQMWYIEPVCDGTYRLKNRWSNKYLSSNYSEIVSTYDLHTDWLSQMWVLEPITGFTESDVATQRAKIVEPNNLPTSMVRLESTIYPNPVHSEAMVLFSEATVIKNVQLVNSVGQRFKVNWEQPQPSLCQLDLEMLPAGLYIVKIETSNRPITSKLFKQ